MSNEFDWSAERAMGYMSVEFEDEAKQIERLANMREKEISEFITHIQETCSLFYRLSFSKEDEEIVEILKKMQIRGLNLSIDMELNSTEISNILEEIKTRKGIYSRSDINRPLIVEYLSKMESYFFDKYQRVKVFEQPSTTKTPRSGHREARW